MRRFCGRKPNGGICTRTVGSRYRFCAASQYWKGGSHELVVRSSDRHSDRSYRARRGLCHFACVVVKPTWGGAAALEPAPKPADRIAPAKARGWKHGWQTWLALNETELTWTALLIGLIVLASLFA
jgi:hypothetical protein